jgi:hypothetical protein
MAAWWLVLVWSVGLVAVMGAGTMVLGSEALPAVLAVALVVVTAVAARRGIRRTA